MRLLTSYYANLFKVVVGGLIIISFVNLKIDPYCLMPGKAICSGKEVDIHNRISKAFQIFWLRPKAAIFGVSNAEIGFDPRYPGFDNGFAYNAATAGGSFYQIEQFFKHTQNQGRLGQAVLGLDFFTFNANWRGSKDFDPLSLVGGGTKASDARQYFRFIQLMLSADMLNSSFKSAIFSNSQNSTSFNEGQEISSGRTDYIKKEGKRKLLFSTVEQFARNTWVPSPEKNYCFHNYEIGINTLEIYRNLLVNAYSNNIDLRMALMPPHAGIIVAIDEAGLMPTFLKWKRSVIRINEEEALRAGRKPYPILDFATINPMTEDELLSLDDDKKPWRWYLDPSHFNSKAGDLILNRLFSRQTPNGYDESRGFGVLLTSDNIDKYFAVNESQLISWRTTHSEEVSIIKDAITSSKIQQNISLECVSK